MATKTHPSTLRPTTDTATGFEWLRVPLLAGTYAVTLLGVGALSLLGAVYLNDALALPVAAQLAVWVLGIAGAVSSPALAARAFHRVADRFEAGDTRRGTAASADAIDPIPLPVSED